MNERYAVDPAAPADARELKLLLDQFGLQTGRFLARYPQDWPAQLLAQVGKVSEMDRQRVLDLLQRRKASLMPVVAPFVLGSSWANNAAIAIESHRAFAGVIGQKPNGFGWPTTEQVLYEDGGGLHQAQGAHVPMKAASYQDCARPLFNASAEVTLIDSYFTLRNKGGRQCHRRWPVMQTILKEAEASGTCQTLRLVLERAQIEATEGTEDQLEQDLEAAIAEARVERVGVEYEVRDSVGHGRYLISIHGGLQFDQGFEESQTGNNHVHWLSTPELEPLLRRFGHKTNLAAR